jgi:hypothetical protein
MRSIRVISRGGAFDVEMDFGWILADWRYLNTYSSLEIAKEAIKELKRPSEEGVVVYEESVDV